MMHIPISNFEKKLTYLIANKWSHRRMDRFMVMVSDPYQWLIPSIALSMILIYFNWELGLKALLSGGVSAGIADTINTRFIKKSTDRVRPGKQYPDIRSLGIMNKGKKSFPSNHASNTMAFAVSFSLWVPEFASLFLSLSVLVGYSRIYCGAHFPLDVIFGWLHGAFWVFILFSLISFW